MIKFIRMNYKFSNECSNKNFKTFKIGLTFNKIGRLTTQAVKKNLKNKFIYT